MGRLMNIGFGNLINTDRVLMVSQPDAAPIKRMIQRGKEEQTLIDATQGRRTKSVIVTTEDRLVLSALTTETIMNRYNEERSGAN